MQPKFKQVFPHIPLCVNNLFGEVSIPHKTPPTWEMQIGTTIPLPWARS